MKTIVLWETWPRVDENIYILIYVPYSLSH